MSNLESISKKGLMITALGLVPVMLLYVGLSTAIASTNIVLATDYPYADTFMQMVRRSAADFCAVTQSHPEGIEVLVVQGYSPYLFPEGCSFDVAVDGKTVRFHPQSSSSYGDGEVFDSYYVGAVIPGTDLNRQIEVPKFVQRDGKQVSDGWELIDYRNFRGAEWLYDGYSWDEVERGLKLDRIVTHLTWVSGNYQYDSGSEMPASLEELEAYVGVARNPVCWDGVELVNSSSDVAYSTGSLFVGWEGDEWVISGNLGPEILTYRFSYDNDYGFWKSHPFMGGY